MICVMHGKVKWFSREKGYGYITSDIGGEDHYFNVRDIQGIDLPKNGDIVSFDSREGHKGLRAASVEIVVNAQPGSGVHGIDERVACGYCGKKMVPRLVFGPTFLKGRSVPIESVCPFCTGIYKKFSSQWRVLAFLNNLFLFLFFFVVFISLVGSYMKHQENQKTEALSRIEKVNR